MLLTKMAGGGWTPGVLPEVAGILETTAGSVCTISLPEDRPDLWEKVSPVSSFELDLQDELILGLVFAR